MKNALNFLFIVIVFAIAFNFFHAAKIYAQSGISDPNIVLGRPSDKSVTMSILSDSNIEAYIVYGISSEIMQIRQILSAFRQILRLRFLSVIFRQTAAIIIG